VIVVVATTEANVGRVRARLGELGVSAGEVLAPSATRRLVLTAVADEAEGQRLVAQLRGGGELAVMRPAAGARLEAWRRHTLPITIADRLTICFAWSEHDRRHLQGVVEFDPGGGFGTAEHPATRLLVDVLVERVGGGERILDIGCGSGILGLCALRLGSTSMIGIDIDEDAIPATRRNAMLNGLDGRVDATSAPLGSIGGAFEIVVANIGRAGLVELAPQIVRRVAPSGWLAVSGFSPSQGSQIAAFLSPLEVVDQRVCDDWCALVLARRRSQE